MRAKHLRPTLLTGRKRLRGVASVEAVIALPVFVILFVGIVYLGKRATVRFDVEQQARNCAFRYSANNCGTVPSDCIGIVSIGTTSGSDAVERALAGGTSKLGTVGSTIGDVIDAILTRGLEVLEGRTLLATATTNVARPPLFGGKSVTIGREYALPCNLTPEDPESVAKDAWHIFKP